MACVKFHTVYSSYKTSSQLRNWLDGLEAGRLVSKPARGCESGLNIFPKEKLDVIIAKYNARHCHVPIAIR